ncbi:hypothetical protein [Flaviflexus huanghaiensis]|uniref:hypothetical protein n=1 Tax=Flaviflexus huanghaiensis TaxID=1111473 RepID=UPI0015F9545A|nr:hypothetical protein [Flaviflexus huanghaiensis]
MVTGDSPLVGALSTLGQLPEASAGTARVAQAVRSVRFSTGLRRGWEAARAEASIHWVVSDCRAANFDVSATELREQIARNREPEHPRAAAAWRCHSDATADMPPLNTQDRAPSPPSTVRAMLAGLHRDASSVDPGRREGAAIFSVDDAARQELIIDIAEAPAPAIVTLSVLLGQWLLDPLVAREDSLVRDSFVRWLGTIRGFEPTGTAVLDLAGLSTKLDSYGAGTPAGMSDWMSAVADTYVEAMNTSLRISQSILAGRTDPTLG